jgi:hypothetical protein
MSASTPRRRPHLGEPFEEKMNRLTATLKAQQEEAAKLDASIAANLKALGYAKMAALFRASVPRSPT